MLAERGAGGRRGSPASAPALSPPSPTVVLSYVSTKVPLPVQVAALLRALVPRLWAAMTAWVCCAECPPPGSSVTTPSAKAAPTTPYTTRAWAAGVAWRYVQLLFVFVLGFLAFPSVRWVWYNGRSLSSCAEVLRYLPDAAASALASSKQSILHVTFHDGTRSDVEMVADALGLKQVAALNPPHGYTISRAEADEVWAAFKGVYTCCDYTFVSDTIPAARPILQHLQEFNSRVVLVVTNRFDNQNSPDEEWVATVRAAAKHPRVRIVANNPYDKAYLRHAGVDTQNVAVIRPLGVAPSGEQVTPPAVRTPSFFVLTSAGGDVNHGILVPQLRSRRVPFVQYPRQRYGGPAAVCKHAGIISLPYQVSVMSMWENLRCGAVYLLPTPAFLLRLASEHGSTEYRFLGALSAEALQTAEWYVPEHADAGIFIYFDSWEELAVRASDELLIEATRQRVLAFMAGHTARQLDAWKHVMSTFGFNASAVHDGVAIGGDAVALSA